METLIRRSRSRLVIALILTSLAGNLLAGPTYKHGSWKKTSLGIRLGWSGGPNGLSLRKQVLPGQAFEMTLGYNGKAARHADIPAIRKGCSFLGASYSPSVSMAEGNLQVDMYADFGARMRYHHYRRLSFGSGAWKVTPDLIAGAGMQVEFSESVQVFGDIHLNYYNRSDNVYVPGVESGVGIRLVVN